jgi:Agenet domain
MSCSHVARLRIRRSAAALLLSLASACAPPKAASPPENSAAFTPLPDLSPGTPVLVERNGQWLPAVIMGRVGPDRVVVHYDGSDPTWDEQVGLDRLRLAPTNGPSDYRVGEKVLVTAQGRWLLAEVIQQLGPDTWRVHYDGYGVEVSENVKLDRLRRPFSGLTAHPPGEPVAVDLGGRLLGASILVPVAADRWLVRLDGFGPEYDQEVTADRLRLRPRAPVDATAPAQPAAPAVPASAPSPALPNAATPARSFQTNDDVLVAHRGVYHLAAIIGPGANGRWRVRYKSSAVGNESITSDADEEVAADRLSRFASAEKEKKGARLALNQSVFVEYHGLFFPGRIVKIVEKGQFRIRYDNFGPEADEVIPTRRIRTRP